MVSRKRHRARCRSVGSGLGLEGGEGCDRRRGRRRAATSSSPCRAIAIVGVEKFPAQAAKGRAPSPPFLFSPLHLLPACRSAAAYFGRTQVSAGDRIPKNRCSMFRRSSSRRWSVLAVVHVVRTFALSEARTPQFLLRSRSFRRATTQICWRRLVSRRLGADIWTFFTYAFIHADFTHIGRQCGVADPVRYGAGAPFRGVALFGVHAGHGGGGRAAHLVGHVGQMVPMIGASGRGVRRDGGVDAVRVPARRAARPVAARATATPTAYLLRRWWRPCAIRGS